MKKHTTRKIVTAFAVTAVIAQLFLLSSCAGFTEYKRKVSDIRITMADFTGLADGIWYGEYDAVLVAARVNVTVKTKTVTDIELIEHKNDRGGRAEAIIPKIIEEQTLLLDTVSGATNSSRVIQKAIQNALEKAKK